MKRAICWPLIAALVLPYPLWAQEELRDAAVSPISVIGHIPTPEQAIIAIRLEAELSQIYKLVSQDVYARAE